MGNDFTTTPVTSPVDVAPLFVPDMDTLKSRLRLSGAAQDDALAIIDDVVKSVRIGFYNKLSSDRVTEIAATSSTHAPSTTAQLDRALAEQVEVSWCRLLLLRRLPSLFVDGSGNSRQIWNEEAHYTSPYDGELERLKEEINEGLSSLESGEDESTDIHISTIGPSTTPPRPGESINYFQP